MYVNRNQNKGLIILLFIFWPFMSLITGFKNYRSGWFKNLIWAFTIFYCLTFSIGKENSDSDIVRYIEEVKELHEIKDLSWEKVRTYYISTGEIDFLRTVIAVVVSRISSHKATLLLVYGIIFGFFFSRNIVYILNLLNKDLNFWQKVLILLLILVVPIWFINGFRMYTAFHVFMYGLLPYVIFGNKKMLLFSFSTLFIHYSFLIPITVLVIYFIFGNRYKIYFILFLLSLVIAELNVSVITNLFDSYVPDFMIDRTSSYLDKDKIESYRSGENKQNLVWYAIWYLKLFGWALQILIMYLFFKKRSKIEKSDTILNLYSLALLFFTFSNFASSFPSGVRFTVISNFLTVVMLLLYIKEYPKDYKLYKMLKLVSPLFLIFVVVSFRIFTYSAGVNTLIGNPITALFSLDENISINDIIK